MRSAPLLLLLFLSALFQTGCFAIGIGYEGNDRFRQEPAILTMERATFTEELPKGIVDPVVRKEDLLNAWGPPDRTTVKNGRESWVYREGIRWNGIFILPVAPIPIPLVVPVGSVEFTVEFLGEKVVAIETLDNTMTGGGVCTFLLVHGGLGCFTRLHLDSGHRFHRYFPGTDPDSQTKILRSLSP